MTMQTWMVSGLVVAALLISACQPPVTPETAGNALSPKEDPHLDLPLRVESVSIPGLAIDVVWFNGYQHLKGGSVKPADDKRSSVETMGPAQGERLSTWLRKQVWNKDSDGAPVQRVPGEALKTVTLHDDLEVTILGPTPTRLEGFIDGWEDETGTTNR